MKIAETGYWLGNDTDKYHAFDEPLANALLPVFKNSEIGVFDFGCGKGKYVEKIVSSGIRCFGYDGNPDTGKAKHCYTQDLTIPFEHTHPMDWTLCLEVGEHIPKELTKQFISNLKASFSKGIVISWAIPGQGGDGHVNELPNEEVIKMFSEYNYDAKTSQMLRDAASLWWFKNTIMVFRKV
jgi:hypothetical protein